MLMKSLLVLVGAVVACLLVGFLLPRTAHVERSVVIARPAADAYAVLVDMSRFNDWSPWHDLDPKATYTFTGPKSGVGARMAWAGDDKVGSGAQEIKSVEPNARIELSLEITGVPPAQAAYRFAPDGANGCKVTWAFDTDLGNNPLSRWVGLLLDHFVGPDYEKGLAKLKTLVESAPATAPAAPTP